jgi:hypothetical protein
MKSRNAFRRAVTTRELVLANSEKVAAAWLAAYQDPDATAKTLAAADAEQDRAELALDTAQDGFEEAMSALGHTQVPDELVRALGGRTFDPATGDLR